MKLIKSYKQYLLERSTDFLAGPDEDKPGNNQIVIFNDRDIYNTNGLTHGLLSHAIKHLEEFKPLEVNRLLDETINYLKSSGIGIIKSLNPDIDLKNDKTKINRNTILNTFDLINDKISNSVELTTEEQEIKSRFLDRLQHEYQNLIDDYYDNNINVDKSSLSEIIELIESGTKIKFSCLFRGQQRESILNPVDTGMLSTANNSVLTLFRIDKSGNDLIKVKNYFNSNYEIFNSELDKFFKT